MHTPIYSVMFVLNSTEGDGGGVDPHASRLLSTLQTVLVENYECIDVSVYYSHRIK